MNTLNNRQAVRHMQGFHLYELANEEVEVMAVPELGSRIVSLKNARTGREWLWHPRSGLKLFGNLSSDDFSRGPLVGIDECFPTITPCVWQGRSLPDHGELWNAAWEVDDSAWQNGVLTTSVHPVISPFRFERTLQLEGNKVRLHYRLSSLSETEERFLWALHPLLRLQTGDQLRLPESSRIKFNGAKWIDAIDSAVPEKKCAKAFASPVSEGWASVQNVSTGDGLEFSWDPAQNSTLGLWLTRDGWHGHDHFAIEPGNADHDCLATAAAGNRCGVIQSRTSVEWDVCLRVDG